MNNKLRVLHVSKYYYPYIGGIESVCRDFCSALSSFAEQQVICFNTDKKTVKEDINGVLVTRVGSLFTVASQSIAKGYGKELQNIIDTFKPDVIRFDYPNPFALFHLLKAMKKSKFSGAFHVFWHMDIIKQKMIEPLFRKQIRRMIDYANLIFVTSPNYLHDTSYLPQYVDKKNIVVTPLRIGDERLNINEQVIEKANSIKKDLNGKKMVFFFGRHVEYKGIRYLIESDAFLDKDKVHIVIGGKGPLTEELAIMAKPYSNIEFVGRLSDEDINAYLLACDLFAFPSITRNEAFGISLAEALYFGKPALTFTIPGSGVNFVSVHNETGLEAENRNIKQYADNINKLISDEKLYEKLSQGASKRARELFSKEKFEGTIIDIYQDILKSKSNN